MAEKDISDAIDHIDSLFRKKAEPLPDLVKYELALKIKGYDQKTIDKYMLDYDEEHRRADPTYGVPID